MTTEPLRAPLVIAATLLAKAQRNSGQPPTWGVVPLSADDVETLRTIERKDPISRHTARRSKTLVAFDLCFASLRKLTDAGRRALATGGVQLTAAECAAVNDSLAM